MASRISRRKIDNSSQSTEEVLAVRCFDARRACRITESLQKLHIQRPGPRE
jgi:hypothetical protein